jgi:peptidoglycan/LPS O-acetylase OafA/YrhL
MVYIEHDWSGAEHLTTFRPAALAPARPATASPATDRAYFPALDGIRGLAFVMVFVTHYLQLPWGWTGVNIFFVLSGFLITGILYNTRNEPHHVRTFYIRRTLRIFPLYYGVMLLIVLLYPIFRWQWSWAWLLWPAYLGNMARIVPPGVPGSPSALLQFAQPLSRTFPSIQLSLGHFWSLCVEEQFYLLWPWVIFGIKGTKSRSTLIRICAAGILVMPLLRILTTHTLLHTADPGVLLAVTPFPFDALLIGSLIALARRSPWAYKIRPAARILFVMIIAVFVFWLTRHPYARHIPAVNDFYSYPPWTFTWGVTFIDLFAASLIVMALEQGSLTFRLFNLRPLRWLGRISYGAYVFHDILRVQIGHLLQPYTAHWVYATAAVGFVATLLLAWASFRWFETPFIRLKDRWTIASTRAEEQTPQESTAELIPHVA